MDLAYVAILGAVCLLLGAGMLVFALVLSRAMNTMTNQMKAQSDRLMAFSGGDAWEAYMKAITQEKLVRADVITKLAPPPRQARGA